MKTQLKNNKTKTLKKAITRFRIQIRSRHPSHSILRSQLQLMPFRTIVRFGSTTQIEDGKNRVEINSIESIKNSSNKLRMKTRFREASVKTAPWWINNSTDGNSVIKEAIPNSGNINISELPFPIVTKSLMGSRGRGNTLIRTLEDFNKWKVGKSLSNYIYEKFMPYKYEYRFHVNKVSGAFYVCRKALREDVPENKRWVMNDSTCVWYVDTNPKFFRPGSYKDIETECLKALDSLGLDFCAFDVRVQSETNAEGTPRKYQDFFIIEGNSAPSFADITAEKYLEQIPLMLNYKKIKENE